MMKNHIPSPSNTVLCLLVLMLLCACGSSDQLELSGTLERKTLEVSAPISEIIVDLPVKVGEHVNKGDIIVQLDTEVTAAELRAHDAGLSAAEALLKEANGEYLRQEKLRLAKISTTQSYDRARRLKDEAIAAKAEKEARITQAKKRLADLTIRARSPGTLDQLPYEIGERVPAGGVVAVISADAKPWVRLWLPARALLRVKPGQEAMVKIAGLDQWFAGSVEYVAREPEFTPHYALTERESAHLVYETRVRLTDPKRDLPPGLPAYVRLMLVDE